MDDRIIWVNDMQIENMRAESIALQLRDYCVLFSRCDYGCIFCDDGYCKISDSPYKWRV